MNWLVHGALIVAAAAPPSGSVPDADLTQKLVLRGGKIVLVARYTEEGQRVIVRLPNGTTLAYPRSAVDLDATKKANQTPPEQQALPVPEKPQLRLPPPEDGEGSTRIRIVGDAQSPVAAASLASLSEAQKKAVAEFDAEMLALSKRKTDADNAIYRAWAACTGSVVSHGTGQWIDVGPDGSWEQRSMDTTSVSHNSDTAECRSREAEARTLVAEVKQRKTAAVKKLRDAEVYDYASSVLLKYGLDRI